MKRRHVTLELWLTEIEARALADWPGSCTDDQQLRAFDRARRKIQRAAHHACRWRKPREKDRRTCAQPDRHVPKLVCGYPLPCPHHTLGMPERSAS